MVQYSNKTKDKNMNNTVKRRGKNRGLPNTFVYFAHLLYSCGYGEEYHVWMSNFPNSMTDGHRI